MNTSLVRKIIWAVDAFEESHEIQDHVVQTLRILSKKCEPKAQLQIEPVYALSSDQLNLPHDYGAHSIDHYEPAAKQALNQKLKQIRLPHLMDPKVLIHRHSSLRSLVQHFLHYAEEAKADLIVVGSHGRKGISRLLLGSFAESLLSISTIPILVIGENTKTNIDFSHMLYPTHLQGEPSESTFPQALTIAKQLNSKITVLHAIPRLMEPAFQSGVYLLGGGWIPLVHFSEKEEDKQKKIAEKWTQFAAENGADCNSIVDAGASGVVDSILKQTENGHIDFIMIQAQRGPVASAFLGSITRQIARLAPCPVWVLRSS